MLSAFIIDDDKYAVEAVYGIFPWEELGVGTIYKFYSPVGIVERINNDSPDIVFIDIEIYNVSGLDIIRQCKESHSDALFVVVSGHDNFKYAHAAIALDVVYYLLKPIDPNDVLIATQKLKALLENKNCSQNIDDYAGTQKNKTDEQWGKITEYISENYNKKINVDDICKYVFISRRTFFYLVKQYTNLSFTDYLTNFRMKQAKILLETTQLPLSEIAESVGITDYNYFSKLFKKATNISPIRYRQQKQEGL